MACELDPDTTPEDADWGERYFHLTDPANRGEIRKLLINIPPRHMKSISVAVAWPAWTWAQ